MSNSSTIKLSEIRKSVERSNEDIAFVSNIEDVLEDVRNGKMVILIDDESRENEGDLIIPAQMATPETVNFMATHGRGLICLAMEEDMVDRLGLPLMASVNSSRHSTAFTISIEAKKGVTTGISAPDRARTIQVAIDPNSTPSDIASPGHVFPLRAKKGGVLVRAGHTEAAVDLARLAGLSPAGVICEIMNEDGSMSRLSDLLPFAQRHALKVGTIADLIRWRVKHEHLVNCSSVENIRDAKGRELTVKTYVNSLNGDVATVVLGGKAITVDKPVSVRVHNFDMVRDGFGISESKSVSEYIDRMAKDESFAFVMMPAIDMMQPENDNPLSKDTELRTYGIGAQILRDLGIRDMILYTSSEKNLVAIDGFGLRVIEQRQL